MLKRQKTEHGGPKGKAANSPVDALGKVWQDEPAMTASKNQPSLTRRASITGGTAMYRTVNGIGHSMILVLAAMLFLAPARAAEDFAVTIPSRYLLGYDAGLPLGAKAQKALENDTFTRYHVTYLNDRGDTVPGILTLPKTTNGPFQTVFFQHGMGDTKDCNYMLKGINRFVELGYAVIAIDALGFGERSTPITKNTSPVMFFGYPFLLRSVFIQTAVDVRRGVDFLLTRAEIDKNRIYYVGNSMGSLLGVMPAAVDKRFKRAVFIVGGADYAHEFTMTKLMGVPAGLFEVLDPKNYVGLISPRPVLMINATRDELVPKGAADAFFTAAREPKTQVWMDSQHDIDIVKGVDLIVDWFHKMDAAGL
jgi:uncharacterized protein